jgi:hypothetical protein
LNFGEISGISVSQQYFFQEKQRTESFEIQIIEEKGGWEEFFFGNLLIFFG